MNRFKEGEWRILPLNIHESREIQAALYYLLLRKEESKDHVYFPDEIKFTEDLLYKLKRMHYNHPEGHYKDQRKHND